MLQSKGYLKTNKRFSGSLFLLLLPIYAAAGMAWKAAGRFWLCGKVAHS